MKTNSKITMTVGQLQKLVNETVFDQKELRALANESQWMSIEEYVKKNDLDLDEFLGRASTNGEPMSPDAKLPIDELDYYASNCEKSSKGYKQSKIFVFGIQWDTHDETTNPLPCRAKVTVPTPNGKADKQGIHDYLYSIYKVEPLDFDWEDLTNDLPHGMFAPSWGEQVKEEEGDAAKASVDKEAMENKLYRILKQEAMDFSSNYTNPLDLWDIDVITREDRNEYQAGGASPGSEYKYAVKWGYDAAVDIALEDHEWTYVMVYEEPESEEEVKNQYTFDDVVNVITQSHLRDKYEEIQCGSFEHGHFKYIVFVEKESKAKATLNENTKFTLTIGQLRRLVKESRKLTVEHEEVSVVTPSGEHLGMLDDEGNFLAGEYPSDRFDCGEIVDDDGEYARMCGCFTKEYGYKDAKPKVEPKVDVFPMDKMFYGKMPKDEGQAIYYLYQMVCIAQEKKKSPIEKAYPPEIVKTFRSIYDILGVTDPEIPRDMIDFDEVNDHYVQRANGNRPDWVEANTDDCIDHAFKFWNEGLFDFYSSKRANFAWACQQVLMKHGIGFNDLKQIKKLLLDYYRTEKPARSSKAIASFLQEAVNNSKLYCLTNLAKFWWEVMGT